MCSQHTRILESGTHLRGVKRVPVISERYARNKSLPLPGVEHRLPGRSPRIQISRMTYVRRRGNSLSVLVIISPKVKGNFISPCGG